MYIQGNIDDLEKEQDIKDISMIKNGSGWELQKDVEGDTKIYAIGVDFNSNLINSISKYCVSQNEKILADINGPFSCVLVNDQSKKISVVVDRFNRIPLYYYFKNGEYIISTDISFIIKEVSSRISKTSLREFLYLGYVLGENTLFQNINTTKSGSVVKYQKGDTNFHYYWNYQPNYVESGSSDIDLIYQAWKDSVEKRLNIIDGDILILLSGGLDSRAILATALECVDHSRITVATFGRPKSDDFLIGKQIANRFNLEQIEMGMECPCVHDLKKNTIDTDGMIDTFPRFPVNQMERLAKNNDYILTGYIGDFITGGHYKGISYGNRNELIRSYLQEEKNRGVESIFSIDSQLDNHIDRISTITNPAYTGAYQELFMKEHIDKWSTYTVFRHRDQTRYLSPFLDNGFVDNYLNISEENIKGQKIFKHMLYQKYPEIFEIPVTSTYKAPLTCSERMMFLYRIPNGLRRRVNHLTGKIFNKEPFFISSTNYISYDRLIKNSSVFSDIMEQVSSEYIPSYLKNNQELSIDSANLCWETQRHILSLGVIEEEFDAKRPYS